MLLLCGATGAVGFCIARRLAAARVPFRALARAGTDATKLSRLGVEVVRGDLRDPGSLEPALAGADTVVTTVSAMARILGGEKLDLRAVERDGTLALIEGAEASGVRRFVYVSAAGVCATARSPLDECKWACEERLRASRMQAVILRPEAFMEVWFSPLARFDWRAGRASGFGSGAGRVCWVSIEDVAAACVRAATMDGPPGAIEFGGPEALSLREVAGRFRATTGRELKLSFLPRPLARLIASLARPFHPALSSLFLLGLRIDAGDGRPDARELRALGIEPTPLSRFIEEQVRPAA
jgi:uncharacterized protein YbjT (DUF2867 family)